MELNEHIEVLETAIQFKNETIASRELKANQILESEVLHTETAAKLQHISHAQAKALLASYFDEVVELRLMAGKKEKEHLKMAAEIEEKKNVIQSYQRSVKQVQVEMERRLLSQEKVRREKQMLWVERGEDVGMKEVGKDRGVLESAGMKHFEGLTVSLHHLRCTSNSYNF